MKWEEFHDECTEECGIVCTVHLTDKFKCTFMIKYQYEKDIYGRVVSNRYVDCYNYFCSCIYEDDLSITMNFKYSSRDKEFLKKMAEEDCKRTYEIISKLK